MKKIFTLLAAVSISLAASAQNFWNMATWGLIDGSEQEYDTTADLTKDGLKYWGTPSWDGGGEVTYEGYTFNFKKRLKFGGNSTFTSKKTLSRVFEFEAKAGEQIYVFCVHGSATSTEERTVYISDAITTTDRDASTALASITLTEGAKGVVAATAKTDGPIYVWTAKNTAVYAISAGYTLEEIEKLLTPAPEPAASVEFKTTSFSGVLPTNFLFDNLYTPFEYDADTHVATLTNFLGSSASFSIKFNPSASQANTFDSAPDSGLESDGYGSCTITGFNGPIGLSVSGSPYCTLSDIVFMDGFYSQMETSDEAYTFYLVFRGKYADASGNNDGKPQYIQLEASIPANGSTSGLAAITADENAPVEYFNLQGIRISEPSAGQIVIRRQGSKVSKIVVR